MREYQPYQFAGHDEVSLSWSKVSNMLIPGRRTKVWLLDRTMQRLAEQPLPSATFQEAFSPSPLAALILHGPFAGLEYAVASVANRLCVISSEVVECRKREQAPSWSLNPCKISAARITA
jgi:hypothetical protein